MRVRLRDRGKEEKYRCREVLQHLLELWTVGQELEVGATLCSHSESGATIDNESKGRLGATTTVSVTNRNEDEAWTGQGRSGTEHV